MSVRFHRQGSQEPGKEQEGNVWPGLSHVGEFIENTSGRLKPLYSEPVGSRTDCTVRCLGKEGTYQTEGMRRLPGAEAVHHSPHKFLLWKSLGP